MAYQSTTAAGASDVLDKIRLFAIAQGWTVNRWRDSPESNLKKELCISHADSGYFNLIHSENLYASGQPNAKNDISLQASSGFDATKKTYEQPDESASARCAGFNYNSTKTRNVYLFGNTQYIYVAQELKNNFYTHLCLGKIDKSWNYTGGQFVTATWWNFQRSRSRIMNIGNKEAISIFAGDAFTDQFNYNKPIWGTSFRCDFSDLTGVNWHNTDTRKFHQAYAPNPRRNDGIIEPGYPVRRESKWRTPYGDLIACIPQSMNALSPLLPIVPAVVKDNKTYFPGSWPGVRYVDLSFIDAKQEITLGSDIWMCFPLIAKHTSNAPTSAYGFTTHTLGIAYKK